MAPEQAREGRRRPGLCAALAVAALLAVLPVLPGCGGSSASTSPSPSPKGTPILTLVGDKKTVKLTLAQIEVMPAYTGWAGIKTSVGTIIPPERFTGVRLTDLAKLVGGISKDNGVTVLAKDGYGMTLSYEQIVDRQFVTYDVATGAEQKPSEPLTVILAYKHDGKPLDPVNEGPLRLYVAQRKPGQLVDGHWTVKWINRVVVKAATSEWAVVVKGAVDTEITRKSYISCSSPGCHGAVWADKDGTLWQGIPLWLVVGLVDDANRHGKGAFDAAAAHKGYTVEVRSTSGAIVKLPVGKLTAHKDILLAAKVGGQELPKEYYPVRLVGPGLTAHEMVGRVIKVVVQVPRLKD